MLLIRFLTCALLFLVVITPMGGTTACRLLEQVRADKVAIRAPVECSEDRASSCGADISLDEAKDSYHKLGSDVSNLKTVTDRHLCDAFETRDYYWAPLKQFSDGEAAFAVLRSHAQDGKPFNGDLFVESVSRPAFNGYVIVESDRSTDAEQHLALCSVSQVSHAVGPPQLCGTVAIVTPSETWLRGYHKVPEPICATMATFRNAAGIDFTFDVKTRTDPLEILAALLSVLKTRFELSTEQKVSRGEDGKLNFITIKSGTSLRNSKILQAGWRESMVFDLQIEPTGYGVSITGSAFALVCRQALGNAADYHGLDDAQRATYAAALDSGIDSAIRSSCKKYQKQDDKTIICD